MNSDKGLYDIPDLYKKSMHLVDFWEDFYQISNITDLIEDKLLNIYLKIAFYNFNCTFFGEHSKNIYLKD